MPGTETGNVESRPAQSSQTHPVVFLHIGMKGAMKKSVDFAACFCDNNE